MQWVLNTSGVGERQTTVPGKIALLRTAATVMVVFNWLTLSGQPVTYFNSLHDHNDWTERSTNTIILADTIYWVSAGTDFNQGTGTHLTFLKYNSDGEILNETNYEQSSGRYAAGYILNYGDTGILCLTSFQESGSPHFDLRLTAFDTSGTIYWQETYIDSGFTEAATEIVELADGYLLVGQRYDDDDGDMLLVKVNQTGEFVWKKTYGGSNFETGNSAVVAADGGFLLLGWTRSFGAGLRDFYLVKTDSNGNQIWQETYGSSGEDGGSSIDKLADGNYILTGTGTNSAVTSSFGRLYKVDSYGDVIWQDSYTFESNFSQNLHHSIESIDGGIVSVGFTNSSSNAGWLLKVSSDGDIIWQREYDESSSLDNLYFLTGTSDKGFLLSGQAINFENNTQDGWLLKVDSIGCPYPNCTVGIDEEEKTVVVDVWPNPTADILNIEKVGSSKQLNISVFNLSGKLVYGYAQNTSEETIDVSSWANGIYVLQGVDEEGRSFSLKVVKQ